jgi:hypothetical protein|tara:strand:+ start:18747 stop:18893 length:147 start_codon:yes stop_codon:yes gene_type:complete
MKNRLKELKNNVELNELANFCNENFSTHFKEQIENTKWILENVIRKRI